MQTRTILGILLIVAGISFYASAGAVMVQTLDRSAEAEEQINRADTSCRQQIVRLGRLVPLPDDQIRIEIEDPDNPDGLRDPRRTLADATAALAMCTGREILSACIGTTCDTDVPGPIRMTLVLGRVK